MKTPRNPARPKAASGSSEPPMFVTWKEGDEAGRQKAFAVSANGLARMAEEQVVRRGQAAATSIYENIAPGNTSVREGFDRRDWDWFRPNERLPTLDRDVMLACMQAYDRIGIVHNVIDTMSDFAVQGISLVHKQPQVEKFYQSWFRQVNGPERTERMLNMLYRAGNVVIRRSFAQLNQKAVQNVQRGIATYSADVKVDPPLMPGRHRIPWEYTILNPVTVEVIGGELAPFVGKKAFRFAVRIPETILKKMKQPRLEDKEIVGQVPLNIMTTVSMGGKFVPLDPDKVTVLYYKKDDWQVWAKPMTFSILSDLQMLNKFKLADLAALDGVISHIRIWKLGNIAAKMLPTETAIERLATMLLNNVGGGTIDLVWGPELEFQETGTDVQKFLGEMKYIPTLKAIYAGLGIPASLTGEGEGGFNNNFISLRTLTERLAYGRRVVTEMWAHEISLVQRAMSFAEPAEMVFDVATLTDDSAEKRLLIELMDRNVISLEALQERFGLIPEIEKVRQRREERYRKNGTLPPRAGPWYNPQRVENLEKIFAQNMVVTPSQVGVELQPNKAGEKTGVELQAKFTPKPVPNANKGEPGVGHPPGKKDTKKRLPKRVKPRQSVKAASDFISLVEWAGEAQASIAEIANAGCLHGLGKKTLRQLTDSESDDLERFKFHLLCSLEPFSVVDAEVVGAACASALASPEQGEALLTETVCQYAARHGRPPGVDAIRRFQAAAYASMNCPGVSEEEQPQEV